MKSFVRIKARFGYDPGDLLPDITAGCSNLNIADSVSDYSGDAPVFRIVPVVSVDGQDSGRRRSRDWIIVSSI